MALISSSSNATIKAVRALRNRKTRDSEQVFFVEGIRLVAEALALNAPLKQIIYAPALLESAYGRAVVTEAQNKGLPILEVTPAVFASVSEKDNPQGLAAVAGQQWQSLASLKLGDGLGWVALQAAQDPGNIGTILRTCDAVGISGLLLLDNSADPYDSSAVRASMGAIFNLKLARASFDQFAAWQQQNGYAVVGSSDSATVSYRAYRYPSPCILLMGSEQKGLSAQQQEICTAMVSIPMRGRSDSLNLAVATGVLLYEMLSQQGG
jgi:RNA methyltransferase, TrmH family